jgi:hypothetical protein
MRCRDLAYMGVSAVSGLGSRSTVENLRVTEGIGVVGMGRTPCAPTVRGRNDESSGRTVVGGELICSTGAGHLSVKPESLIKSRLSPPILLLQCVE